LKKEDSDKSWLIIMKFQIKTLISVIAITVTLTLPLLSGQNLSIGDFNITITGSDIHTQSKSPSPIAK
jgi:hypothetical protein